MHSMSSALFIARNLWLQKSIPTEKSGWALHSALFPDFYLKWPPWSGREGGGVARTHILKNVTGALRGQQWSNHKHLSSVCCRVQHTSYSIYRVQHTIYKNCKSMHKYNKMQCWYLVCKVLCCFWHLLPTLEGRCELIFTLTTSGIALHLNLLPIIFQKVSVAD